MADGLALLWAGIDQLAAVEASTVDDEGLQAAWEELERLGRARSAAEVALLAEIDRRGLHQADGHNSVRTMARFTAKLSRGEAARRDQTMRVCRDLPQLAATWRDGAISDCQVALLGRVHANPRVRELMPEFENWFVDEATDAPSFRSFEQRVRHWERLADQDGPEPPDHDRRDAKLIQNDLDLSWDLTGNWASLEGAALDEIFQHYVQAEWLADWEKARAEHGDAACEADLARTARQRRADALAQIFRDAAASPEGAVPARFMHNIVWSASTFEAMVGALATNDRSGSAGPPLDLDDHRCSTIDGTPVDPTEAIVNALLNQVRRVVVDARGSVIDLGAARTFTGSARQAVQLQSTHCVWPGCSVPATQCEIDHLKAHAQGGRTNPGNGAPLCGRHNRWKQKGFTVSRDPTAGTWRTTRPDGSEIEPL